MAVRRLAEQQPETFTFSNDNEEWAKGQIGKFPPGKQQSAVIPLLWRAQEQHDGWLPEPAIRYVADMLGMPYIRALEVATFYTMFNLTPVGKHFVQLCGTTPCMLRGSDELREVCKRVIGPESTVSKDGQLSWLEVECLGACVNAPMVQIDKDYYEDLTPDNFEALLVKLRDGEAVKPGPQSGRDTSYPITGPTSLTDDAAINRVPARETGPVDAATEPVAKAQPKAADERLEEQVASETGEVADEIKARRDGTQAVDADATGSSDIAANIPQGEERSGDAVAREQSSIESSTFAKSENAPVGGGAAGATTGDADAERRKDARRPDPGQNTRVGQEADSPTSGADGTEPASPPVTSKSFAAATPPQVGDAPAGAPKPTSNEARPLNPSDAATVGVNANTGHDGQADGALPKETPPGSVMSETEKVSLATSRATDPANPKLGPAAEAEQDLGPDPAPTSPSTGAQPAPDGEPRGDGAATAKTDDRVKQARQDDDTTSGATGSKGVATATSADEDVPAVGIFDRGVSRSAEGEVDAPDESSGGVAPAAMAGKEPETEEEAAAVREAARQDARAPVVLDRPDGEADDLKRISGIGPKLETTLNALGFYHFAQIAVWTDENVAWVDSHLRFKGRIVRDDWVSQAGTLAGGDETDFARRYVKGETGRKPEWLRDEKDDG